MRRIVLLLTMMTVTLVVAGGIALAVNKIGTDGRDFLKGTNGADNLIGKGDSDRIFGLAGKDNLIGGPGKDMVVGGGERRPSGGDKYLERGLDIDVVLGGDGSAHTATGHGCRGRVQSLAGQDPRRERP